MNEESLKEYAEALQGHMEDLVDAAERIMAIVGELGGQTIIIGGKTVDIQLVKRV